MTAQIDRPSGRKYTDAQRDAMLDMRARGYTRKMVADAIKRDYGIVLSMATLSKILGPMPDAMKARKDGDQEVRVRMTTSERDRLIRIAEGFDLRNVAGEHAGRGSINKLIEAIADGRLSVAKIDIADARIRTELKQ